MLLLGNAQLLGRNFDQIGMAYGEIEPLVADRFIGQDFDFIDEGPAAPVVLVGGECLRDSRIGELKRACTDAASGLLAFACIREVYQEPTPSQQ